MSRGFACLFFLRDFTDNVGICLLGVQTRAGGGEHFSFMEAREGVERGHGTHAGARDGIVNIVSIYRT